MAHGVACTAAAQYVLAELDITHITPTRLATILGITSVRAGHILRELGWHRVSSGSGAVATYHKHGAHKDLGGTAQRLGRRMASRILTNRPES